MSKDQQLQSLDEKNVIEFVEVFIFAIGSFQRHPKDRNLKFENVDKLHALYSDIVRKSEKLILSEFHNHLMFNDSALPVDTQQKPAIGAFIFLMLEYNIRSFSFNQRCSKDEFGDLLSVLALPSEDFRGNPPGALRENNIVNVTITPQGEPSGAVAREEPMLSSFELEPVTLAEKLMSEKNEADEKIPELANIMEKPEFPLVKAEQTSSSEPFSDPEDSELVMDATTRIMAIPAKEIPVKKDRNRNILDVEDRPLGSVHLVVVAKLGRQVVDDAKVTIMSKPSITKVTQYNKGASFFLPPGRYRIIVQYDKYTMNYDIELFKDLDEIQLDINLLDASI